MTRANRSVPLPAEDATTSRIGRDGQPSAAHAGPAASGAAIMAISASSVRRRLPCGAPLSMSLMRASSLLSNDIIRFLPVIG